jgi:hypothetical protein
MKYLKEKLNSGSVAIPQLITWGISILTISASLAYASFNSTTSSITEVKERTATVEEAIRTLKEDNKEIKGDLKIIIQKLK